MVAGERRRREDPALARPRGAGALARGRFQRPARPRPPLSGAPASGRPRGRRHPTLRALGMTRRQLLAVDVVRAAAIGTVAACLAVVLAFAFSPLTPIGLARDLEPNPGFALDVLVLALGGAGVLLLVVSAGAVASLQARTAHRDLEPRAGCPPAEALARWGLPPTAVSGVRLALTRGRGTMAVPVGGTLLGAIASVAVVAVALTFTASIDHLLSTPRLYGQNWDYRTNFIAPPPARVQADPGISDAAEGSDDVEVRLDGRRPRRRDGRHQGQDRTGRDRGPRARAAGRDPALVEAHEPPRRPHRRQRRCARPPLRADAGRRPRCPAENVVAVGPRPVRR